jgi:DNA-3-methyladenine glycosylase II
MAGVAALTRKCDFMRTIKKTAGLPALRRNPPGFLGLCRIVVFQQVSVASGTAIWARVQAGIQPFDAATLLTLSEDDLRGLGLSRPKVRTLQALAGTIMAGTIDLDGLGAHPDATIREKLIALHGIGPWTADIFLMFNLGRADAFASGDLALQEAAKIGFALDARPNAQALDDIAERWRPWRAVAALMLWNYYRVAKQTKGGAPV